MLLLSVSVSVAVMHVGEEEESWACLWAPEQTPTCGNPYRTAAPWCRGRLVGAPSCALEARAHLQQPLSCQSSLLCVVLCILDTC